MTLKVRPPVPPLALLSPLPRDFFVPIGASLCTCSPDAKSLDDKRDFQAPGACRAMSERRLQACVPLGEDVTREKLAYWDRYQGKYPGMIRRLF